MSTGLSIALACLGAGWLCMYLAAKAKERVRWEYEAAALCWFVAANCILWAVTT